MRHNQNLTRVNVKSSASRIAILQVAPVAAADMFSCIAVTKCKNS